MVEATGKYLNRNVILISLSAFFADMGYQAVTAVFAILLVVVMHEPAYIYGLLLALSFGLGSLISLIGGKLGDRFGKKPVALLGNLLIPLMSLSVLFSNLYILGAFFILGWWARYFRSPVRRAWLVEVSDPAFRSQVFGFLHALDIGGGIVAVAYSIVFIIMGISLTEIILLTAIPLLISSFCLLSAGTELHMNYVADRRRSEQEVGPQSENSTLKENRFLFRAVLISATLFGFSYYALGFPIITVSDATGSYIYGILTFGIYLGVSAISGIFLGTFRGKKPMRTLWSLGYLLAAGSSLIIGTSFAVNGLLLMYYIGAAGLGFATGSVETFEPVIIAAVSRARKVSTGMGWLSSSRALGLFFSNSIMGLIFAISVFYSYLYAAVTSFLAALILIVAELIIIRRQSGDRQVLTG